MKKEKVWITIAVLVLLAVAAYFIFRGAGKNNMCLTTAVVHQDTIETTVMATGYVQPVDQVEVGTQVSGVIQKIFVDFNTQVKKGQLLAELDKSTLSEQVSQGRANVTSSQSNLTYARQNFERVSRLYEQKAATQVAYEEAVNSLTQAESQLTNSQANLHQAQVNLSYAEIYSPIDGIVLDRAVEEGQTVAASFNTPTLFTIANDLTNMQVEADVDEADIGRVKLGQRVTFTVDAYNDDVFEGEVIQIRLQPVVTNNVVTYTVVVSAPNPDEKLLPGMTANITIVTQSETGLVVPVEAVNFNMTEEIESRIDERVEFGEAGRGQDVWVMHEGTITRRDITTGIGDGINFIVTSGLREGEEVVLSATAEKAARNGNAVSNPLVPSPPRGGRR